ncbi:hypothetical protein Bealeia1_01606 [Candidatus Bealeia paramacronuclearis]|uniref:Uncharacterized protein n=1 Tax=Candidatus Bealeia paramacronuclearis TaxID=1921001 RepID=A0ABZ2C4M7_9PROT|nr:hypothetical protein [Candidatus Bealeia paramacronuclearis]
MLFSKPALLLTTALIAVSMAYSLSATNDSDKNIVNSSPSKKRKIQEIQDDSSGGSSSEENTFKKKKSNENLEAQIHTVWNASSQTFKNIIKYSDTYDANHTLQGALQKLPDLGKMKNSKSWYDCFNLAVKNPTKINLKNKDDLWKSFFFKNMKSIKVSLEEGFSHYVALKDYKECLGVYENIITHYNRIRFFSSEQNAIQVLSKVLEGSKMMDQKWGEVKFYELITHEMETLPKFEDHRKAAPSLEAMSSIKDELENKSKKVKEDFKKKTPFFLDTDEIPHIDNALDSWRTK